MKILFLSDDFPPESFGGAGIVAFNLAYGLQKLRHQIFVITTVRERSDEGDIDYQGLKIFRIYSKYHERWRAYLSLYNPQTVEKIQKLIKQIKPDIIHAHNIHYYLSYHCLKIAKKYSRAVFLTAHDAMLFHYGKLSEFVNPNDLSIPQRFNYKINHWQQIKKYKKRYNPFRNIIIRYYLKYVDKIFAVSYALKDALNQNGIYNVEVIHNGIDVDEWQVEAKDIEAFKKRFSLKNKKIIFFGGRISNLKGLQQIERAMIKIKEEIPESFLLKVGLQGIGWLAGNTLKAAYGSANLVVTPSLYLDPFLIINLEAMACKKPVIGTCFGGTPEIVQDGVTGYIVNPFDVETMRAKIIDLLKNPQKARRFGEAGYERAKKYFSLDSQIAKILAWYQKMLDDRGKNLKSQPPI